MAHDLLHIQGKPYMLVPLRDYRQMVGAQDDDNTDVPAEILDRISGGGESPLKILRKYRGMTQAELAAEADISRPYLTEIERGVKNGSLAAIKALAHALDVPVGLLLNQ